MENLKNLCGQIPESLHKRVLEDKGPDITNGEYLTGVLTEYFARLDGQTGTALWAARSLRNCTSGWNST